MPSIHRFRRSLAIVLSTTVTVTAFAMCMGGDLAWARLWGDYQAESMYDTTALKVYDNVVTKSGPGDYKGDANPGNSATVGGKNALKFTTNSQYTLGLDQETSSGGFYWVRARVGGAGCAILRFNWDGPAAGDSRTKTVKITNSAAYKEVSIGFKRLKGAQEVHLSRPNGSACKGDLLVDMIGHKNYS